MVSEPVTSDPSDGRGSFGVALMARNRPQVAHADLSMGMIGLVGRSTIGFCRALARSATVRPTVRADNLNTLALRPPVRFWHRHEAEVDEVAEFGELRPLGGLDGSDEPVASAASDESARNETAQRANPPSPTSRRSPPGRSLPGRSAPDHAGRAAALGYPLRRRPAQTNRPRAVTWTDELIAETFANRRSTARSTAQTPPPTPTGAFVSSGDSKLDALRRMLAGDTPDPHGLPPTPSVLEGDGREELAASRSVAPPRSERLTSALNERTRFDTRAGQATSPGEIARRSQPEDADAAPVPGFGERSSLADTSAALELGRPRRTAVRSPQPNRLRSQPSTRPRRSAAGSTASRQQRRLDDLRSMLVERGDLDGGSQPGPSASSSPTAHSTPTPDRSIYNGPILDPRSRFSDAPGPILDRVATPDSSQAAIRWPTVAPQVTAGLAGLVATSSLVTGRLLGVGADPQTADASPAAAVPSRRLGDDRLPRASRSIGSLGDRRIDARPNRALRRGLDERARLLLGTVRSDQAITSPVDGWRPTRSVLRDRRVVAEPTAERHPARLSQPENVGVFTSPHRVRRQSERSPLLVGRDDGWVDPAPRSAVRSLGPNEGTSDRPDRARFVPVSLPSIEALADTKVRQLRLPSSCREPRLAHGPSQAPFARLDDVGVGAAPRHPSVQRPNALLRALRLGDAAAPSEPTVPTDGPAPTPSGRRDGPAPTPSGPSVTPVGERFMEALDETVRLNPAPLPMTYRPLADMIVGRRRVQLSTDHASRTALRRVGKVAATTDDVIHLDPAAVPSHARHEVLAHELTHVANPSPAPRFFADDHHSAEESAAEEMAARVGSLMSGWTAATPSGARPASTAMVLGGSRAGVNTSVAGASAAPVASGGWTAGALAAELTGGRPATPERGIGQHRTTATDGAWHHPSSQTADEQSFAAQLEDHFDLIVEMIERRLLTDIERRGGFGWGDYR